MSDKTDPGSKVKLPGTFHDIKGTVIGPSEISEGNRFFDVQLENGEVVRRVRHDRMRED